MEAGPDFSRFPWMGHSPARPQVTPQAVSGFSVRALEEGRAKIEFQYFVEVWGTGWGLIDVLSLSCTAPTYKAIQHHFHRPELRRPS